METNEFLELFKEVEQKAVITYSYPDDGKSILHLMKEKEFQDLRVALKATKDVRNLLSHYPNEVIKPSEYLIKTLKETLKRLDGTKTLKDIMTPSYKLVSASLDDFVLPKLKELKEKGLSNCPILENGKPIGVYSGLCFSSFLPERKDLNLSALKFFDFGNLVLLNKENPTKVALANSDMKVIDAKHLLRERSLTRPINVLLITKNGSSKEVLMGLLSYSDLNLI